MTKKIAILTQPLHNNYGGLLQAYALKEVLQQMGHEVVIINRQSKDSFQWRKYASYVKRRLLRQPIAPNHFISDKLKEAISENNRLFREKYIPNLSELITTNNGMSKLNDMGFDVLIAGSDQCWRPRYSPAIQNYFLDFAENDDKVKRISYAASFGVSHWEFTDEDTARSKELLKKFDAISVREDSAIDLVRDNLGRDDAIHVVDPTMLLSTKQYNDIVKAENIPQSPGNLKVYILDKTEEKDNFVRQVEKRLKLKVFEVLPAKRLNEEKVTKDNIEDFVYPNPAAWLRGFEDAEFVITDSFHGTVFSILHNIPFVAIGNKARGLSRFESVLKMFGLEERLVVDIALVDIEELMKKGIDWEWMNEVLEKERVKAVDFLKSNLK